LENLIMSARCAIVVALAVAFCPSPQKIHAAEQKPIPTRFEFKFDRAPIWIAATEAVASDGSVRAGVLRSGAREELASRLALQKELRKRGAVATEATDTCDAVFAGVIDGGDTHSMAETFDDLREAATGRSVISGRVTGSAVGLHGGMPYTVIGVETDSWGMSRQVYLLYPFGHMRFEGMTVCNSDADYSAPPAIGDAITFLASQPIDHSETLYAVSGSLIFYDHEGVIVVPPGFKIDAASVKELTAPSIARMLRNTELPREKQQ
jgi:hypothetical protein